VLFKYFANEENDELLLPKSQKFSAGSLFIPVRVVQKLVESLTFFNLRFSLGLTGVNPRLNAF
jgi:hypothetical protein